MPFEIQTICNPTSIDHSKSRLDFRSPLYQTSLVVFRTPLYSDQTFLQKPLKLRGPLVTMDLLVQSLSVKEPGFETGYLLFVLKWF